MKKTYRAFAVAAATLLAASFTGCHVADGGDGSDRESVKKGDYTGLVELSIDGGSQNNAYNTTSSLIYDKYSNPYPYNTLEALVEEWNEANAHDYGYYFTVANTSMNNNREEMVPLLQTKKAPEIVYYLPTTIAEDMTKGYFYDLSAAMETPNKYSKAGEAGSTAWKDLYTAEEYQTFFAPNGHMYTVSMEKNPIGIIYNKTLLTAAGVAEEPDTFKEFMEAQDKINEYAVAQNRADKTDVTKYIAPFFSVYPWYDSFLETTLLSGKMKYLDVITEDGVLDAAEFVRGFLLKDDENKPLYYSPDKDETLELYRLIRETTKYYPGDYKSYYATQQFTAGNLAMLEVTGGDIRELIDSVDGSFEIGVMPYPQLTAESTSIEITGNVRRGLSGYCTGWAISNSAMAKDEKSGNTKCVDACIDILMYLSCFENNDKMVNENGFAIPLSGNTTYEPFQALAEIYETDCANETSIAWAAATAGDAMNKDYYDATVLFRDRALAAKDMDAVKALLSSTTNGLYASFLSAIRNITEINGWDSDTMASWPGKDVTTENN